MLFVFRTCYPSKDILHIVSQCDGRNILQEVLNLHDLEKAIRMFGDLPEGSFYHISTVDNVLVLLWHFTPCKQAKYENFANVFSHDRSFKFNSRCPRGIVSMSYFVLHDKTVLFLIIQMIQSGGLYVINMYTLMSVKVFG